jgi:hypothetical protein
MKDKLGGGGWCADSKSTEREFSITIVEGLHIVQTQSTLTAGILNEPYNFQLSAVGSGTQTWSIVPNSGTPPPGVTINNSTGLISGTPTATGDYTFKVQVTDGTRSDVQTYTISVVQPLKITSGAAPPAELGLPFRMVLAATGGKEGYTWSLDAATPLPDGLTLDPATGVIRGTPTAAGASSLRVKVTDSLGLTNTVDVKLVVAAPLSFVKRALPAAKANHAYNARLRANGGVVPRTWFVAHGSLPVGIRLNTRTGALTGTPKHAGTFRITFVVTDNLGATSLARLVLKVNP